MRHNTVMRADVHEAVSAYAERWRVPISTVIDLACAAFLNDRARRVDHSPIQLRFRPRRGPLSKAERLATDMALDELRKRGGRPQRRRQLEE